jgi:hypothetical protein
MSHMKGNAPPQRLKASPPPQPDNMSHMKGNDHFHEFAAWARNLSTGEDTCPSRRRVVPGGFQSDPAGFPSREEVLSRSTGVGRVAVEAAATTTATIITMTSSSTTTITTIITTTTTTTRSGNKKPKQQNNKTTKHVEAALAARKRAARIGICLD